MNTSRYRQNGAMGSLIFAILIFGGMISLGAKVVPVYMDHNTMSTILDKMAEEPGMGSRGDGGIREEMRKRFKLNNIRDFDLGKHVSIERHGRGTDVMLDYEVRIPLVSNLDLLASFNKKVELRD
ncbi:MAG: DUF4845 domain-containing protein [Pseudomonadales bacterium]|jgi:hypothetical protein|nr:DUF4845 domain-containing protein [Pseudomonadales bacterium]